MECYFLYSAQGDMMKFCQPTIEEFASYSQVHDMYDTYQYLGKARPVQKVAEQSSSAGKYMLNMEYSIEEAERLRRERERLAVEGKSVEFVSPPTYSYSRHPAYSSMKSVDNSAKQACDASIPCCEQCIGAACSKCNPFSYCCSYIDNTNE